MTHRDMHEVNRLSWNEATKAHNRHKGDQAAFFRGGGTTLYPEEIALLGDIRGKRLAHLQCNAGQDTLSIAAHLGAEVTGIDISDEAIAFAQALSAQAGITATFVRSDLFEWFETSTQPFDAVFTSYGVTCWLADLAPWGRGIARTLAPGGRFVLIEFHPMLVMLDRTWSLRYDYMGGQPIAESAGVSDYVGEDGSTHDEARLFRNPHPAFEFAWGIGEVVSALANAGLRVDSLREYPYVNGWMPHENMRTEPGRRHYPPEGMPILPLMFSITATKP